MRNWLRPVGLVLQAESAKSKSDMMTSVRVGID
jgi:hypothetical protein